MWQLISTCGFHCAVHIEMRYYRDFQLVTQAMRNIIYVQSIGDECASLEVGSQYTQTRRSVGCRIILRMQGSCDSIATMSCQRLCVS